MRITVPGGSGWFDLAEPSALTVDQQDEFLDLRDELIEVRRAELPPPGPDPANPAVMAPAPEVRFKRADLTRLQGVVAAFSVTGTSYEGVLPWHDGSRQAMGLPAWNALRAALVKDGAHWDALIGVVPKEESPTTSVTSGISSPAVADAPLPDSGDGTSATPGA